MHKMYAAQSSQLLRWSCILLLVVEDRNIGSHAGNHEQHELPSMLITKEGIHCR